MSFGPSKTYAPLEARVSSITGDGVSSPVMDEILPQCGFGKTEVHEVLVFELGTGQQPRLPRLRVPDGGVARLVEDEADHRHANAAEAGVFPDMARDERDTRAYLRGLSKLEAYLGRKPPDPNGDSIVLRYLASIQESGGGEREVVATAGAEVAGATIRLWGAGTRAEHRGRGAYHALVIESAAKPMPSAPPSPSPRPTPPHRPPSYVAPASGSSPPNAATPWKRPPRPTGEHHTRAPTFDQRKPILVLHAGKGKDSCFGSDSTSCAGYRRTGDMSCVGGGATELYA